MVKVQYRPDDYSARSFIAHTDTVPDEGDIIVPPPSVIHDSSIPQNRFRITEKFYTIESDTTIYLRARTGIAASVEVDHSQYHVVVLRFKPATKRD